MGLAAAAAPESALSSQAQVHAAAQQMLEIIVTSLKAVQGLTLILSQLSEILQTFLTLLQFIILQPTEEVFL